MKWGLVIALLGLVAQAEASFFPDEGPPVPPQKNTSTEKNYDKATLLLQAFEAKMAPSVSKRGGHLRLVLEGDDPKVNARAMREDKDWMIVVYGGLINHPAISEAEMTMVLCHELGHHLGGTPTAARNGWSACEGQADYWSTTSCFKGLMPSEDSAQVALNLTLLYASQGNAEIPLLSSRDLSRPSRTFFGYPSPQCRLDTLLAGLLGETRPACWFVAE